MAAAHDLHLYSHDDFSLAISLRGADGSPRDLSGFTATAKIATAAGEDGDPLVSFAAGFLDDDPTTGTVVLTLTGDQTGTLPTSRRTRWDFALVGPDGSRRTHLAGAVLVTPSVT